MKNLFIIIGMFLVTFSVRFGLYARAHRVIVPDWVENALKFVPVAVLTAIIMPLIVLDKGGAWDFSLNNPWLMGSVAAFVVGLWRKNALLTILVGVLVFFAVRLWLA